MSVYAIFCLTSGNLIDSYDDESDAKEALARIVGDEPEAAGTVEIITFDEHGFVVT
jgi:hypothetical protein